MTSVAGSAQVVLSSQAGPSMPTRSSAQLSNPNSPLKIQAQSMATATPEVTAGR